MNAAMPQPHEGQNPDSPSNLLVSLLLVFSSLDLFTDKFNMIDLQEDRPLTFINHSE